jgi:hypothetical protein
VASGALHSARAAETPLLPRLEAESPDSAYMENSSTEVAGGNRLLMKFNGYIHNGGRGAADVRGERSEPTISAATRKKVEKDQAEEKETLGAPELAELSTPQMTVNQREFFPSSEETNVERSGFVPHTISPKAELFYSASDGHDHWHLQHVARYQLSTMTGEKVSPGQKVGFCLDDSLHTDTSKGPSTKAYADSVPPFRDFCQRFKPETTKVFEGISPGWSDLYGSDLAWQWVDLSNVPPGEYRLEEEVDPEHLLEEEAGGNKSSTSLPVIVPGYDAQPLSTTTEFGQPKTVTLAKKEWVAPKSENENPESHQRTEPEKPGAVEYLVSAAPEHGEVEINGEHATTSSTSPEITATKNSPRNRSRRPRRSRSVLGPSTPKSRSPKPRQG